MYSELNDFKQFEMTVHEQSKGSTMWGQPCNVTWGRAVPASVAYGLNIKT